jgi:pimeloyl-ACP methyl ester carboxylesterase
LISTTTSWSDTVPVLVIGGDHDRVEPIVVLESHVIAEINGARPEVIADSGHLTPLERPRQLSDRIAAFRDAITASP